MREPDHRQPRQPPGGGETPVLPDLPSNTEPVRRTLFERLRAYFLAGVLVAAPLGVTLSLAVWAIDFVDNRIIPARYSPNQFLPFWVPGMGLVVVVVSLTAIGWLTSSFLGRIAHRAGERLLSRIPVIRSVYGAFKQIFESVLAQRSSAFRQVALLEYPRKGVWSMGFVAGVTSGEVQERTEDDVVNVFMPTTPNPTSGYLLFVPRRDLIILDMSVEDGIKMVVSGGIVTPPYQPPRVEERQA